MDDSDKPRNKRPSKKDPILKVHQEAFDQVVQIVSERTGITREEMLSRRRAQPVSMARQAVMWILRKHQWMTLDQIGRLFGRDHTTVIHGLRRAEFRVQHDMAARAIMEPDPNAPCPSCGRSMNQ